MDPTTLTAPSLRLKLAPSACHQFDDASGTRSAHDGFALHRSSTCASRSLLRDQLCNMIAQEERDGYKCRDYLSYYSAHQSGPQTPKSSRNIDEGCRASICGWMYRVADHFSIDREVVSIALSYIDRVLSANHCADRRTFKLISATSFHLAIKVHFPHIGQEVGSLLPDLSRGDFLLDDIVDMEREVIQSLIWLLNPATPQGIAIQILSLLPSGLQPNVANMATFLAELSVCDYFFVTSRKSVVAIAAVLNASESIGFGGYETSYPYLEGLLLEIGYSVDWREVSSARERLWSLYGRSSESFEQRDENSPTSFEKSPQLLQDNPSPTSCVDHRSHHYL